MKSAPPVDIPFVDLSAYQLPFHVVRDILDDVMHRGVYVRGPEVEAFEDVWSDAVGVAHGVGVSSGTMALEMALTAIRRRIGGDRPRVVLPAVSFVATAASVIRAGFSAVYVGVDPITGLADMDEMCEAIHDGVAAVAVPVHLHGRAFDVPEFLRRCPGAVVVEDAAQAHGARYPNGTRVGSVNSMAACWSFYPSKNIGALGDAGMITTSHADMAAELRALRDHGRQHKHDHHMLGTNARMDEFQAAVLRVKTEMLERQLDERLAAALRYDRLLSDRPGITAPPISSGCAWHVYAVQVERRDGVRREMAGLGVETGIHYPYILPDLPVCRDHDRLLATDLLSAARFARRTLSLPLWPGIRQFVQEYVVEALVEAVGR